MRPNTIKQWQIEKNIADCCYVLERYLNQRVKMFSLLQCILPVGWKITSINEDGYKYIERSFQAKQNDFYNVYMSLKHNKVNVYQYYEAPFNKDFQTIRLNLVIDKDNNITFMT